MHSLHCSNCGLVISNPYKHVSLSQSRTDKIIPKTCTKTSCDSWWQHFHSNEAALLLLWRVAWLHLAPNSHQTNKQYAHKTSSLVKIFSTSTNMVMIFRVLKQHTHLILHSSSITDDSFHRTIKTPAFSCSHFRCQKLWTRVQIASTASAECCESTTIALQHSRRPCQITKLNCFEGRRALRRNVKKAQKSHASFDCGLTRPWFTGPHTSQSCLHMQRHHSDSCFLDSESGKQK